MREWILQQWKPACSGQMLLILDVHKVQTTDAIQDCLRKESNTGIYLSLNIAVQVLLKMFCSLSFYSSFERSIKHNINRLDKASSTSWYIHYVSERRVLFTKWVGAAWEEVSSNTEDDCSLFPKMWHFSSSRWIRGQQHQH